MILKNIFKSDEKTLAKQIQDLFTQQDNTMATLERIWWRNILYYMGEHWIEYVRTLGTFRKRRLPNFVPTPVSNDIRQYVRAVKAMLLNQQLVPKIAPNTNEKADASAAKLGEDLLRWMDGINDGELQDEDEKTAIWMAICGTAFQRTFVDADGGIPLDGDLNTGEVSTQNVIPFNIRVDELGDALRRKRWVGVQQLKQKEWVEDTFKVKLKGSDEAQPIAYQKKLMRLVQQVSPWKGVGLDTGTQEHDDKDLVIYREVEFRPSVHYPEGRFISVCRDKILKNVKRMPIAVERGMWYYTLTDFHFDYVPGRFWSDAGMNDLISPQNSINEIDQAFAINRKGLGRPRVITPVGIGIKRVDEGGQGFLAIQYNPALSGGKAPTIENGTPLPDQFLQERLNHKTAIQDSSGDPKNILQGKPPSSKSSGVMVDILRETAEKGHAPDLGRWNRSKSRVYKKRLLVAKELYTEEKMIKTTGADSVTRVTAFRGADLKGNTDVKVELDNGLASTTAGRRQILLDIAEKGYIDVVNNPEEKQEFLNKLGLAGFATQGSVDYKRANAENAKVAAGEVDGLMQMGAGEVELEVAVLDPFFKYDNHAIHFEIHRRFLLSEEFHALEKDVQKAMIIHTDTHNITLQSEIDDAVRQQQAGQQEEGRVQPQNSNRG